MFKKHRAAKAHSNNKIRKRQWGTESDTTPLSYMHVQPDAHKIALSRLSIVMTIVFWAMYVTSVVMRQLIEGPHSYRFTLEVFGYLLVVTFLTFSALLYLITRQGALQRFSKHVRVPRALLEKYFTDNQPSITVLVPSYNEEPSVIRKTLLSAALQEYPKMRVVLLLDDDYKRIKPDDQDRFEETQNLGKTIQEMLAEPYAKFSDARTHFEVSHPKDSPVYGNDILTVAASYMEAAKWLNDQADNEKIEDHVDEFFADQVLRELANDLTTVAEALITSNAEGALLARDRVVALYNRLVWIFTAEMEVFERKRYASLSHEYNKAMNINSYIGLMGGIYKKELTSDGLILLPTDKPEANTITVPDSDFILTLDADSILLQDYCLRLVYFMQQPDNATVAVTQTPYSSFRGAPTRIERLAGATTDVQHILHQGMTYYGATFWVGANAVIRKKALDDIVEIEWVGGYEIKRYVQDRTVIEDTESSIDLALHGWKLVNYPERLSYSATPPDFGSLVVQRRRWANGGLIILSKLLSQLRERKTKGEDVSRVEFMIRLNYMASIAWSNFGLVFLLAYPYDGRLLSPFVLLAAMPYFLAMASDLKYCRYSYFDVLRIYGFNLILLPVNIAGVLKSLEQLLTTKKIPFARTPKVKDRTIVELPYILSPLFIVGFSLFTVWRNIEGQNWGNAAFAAFNALTATMAIIDYIGVGNLFIDLWLGIVDWLYIDVKTRKHKKVETKKEPEFNWKSVLYHGKAGGTVPHTTVDTLISNSKDHKNK